MGPTLLKVENINDKKLLFDYQLGLQSFKEEEKTAIDGIWVTGNTQGKNNGFIIPKLGLEKRREISIL